MANSAARSPALLAAILLFSRLMKAHVLLFLLAAGCASTSTQSTFPTSQSPSPTQSQTAAQPQAEPGARNVLPDLPHERVDYWVERFSRGDKKGEIDEAFGRLPQVETMIREKLRRRGMPEELLYLAMAESGLNPQARSLAQASGIWQLVPDTARRYGLRVDETADERNDPEKSTDAALSYLAYLYNRFGSWYLAAAAYNAGENRIARIMTEATGAEKGTDADYYRFWDRFPGETRDYVPATIALMRIGKMR